MARWFLPLLAAFAILALCGRAVTAYAAAGWVGELGCCCPSPETCKCAHDDDQPHTKLKPCSGFAELVAPTLAGAVEPAPIAPPAIEVRTSFTSFYVVTLSSTLPVPPEPPPF